MSEDKTSNNTPESTDPTETSSATDQSKGSAASSEEGKTTARSKRPKKTAADKARSKAGKTGKWLTGVLFVCLLALVGGTLAGAWWGWEQWQSIQTAWEEDRAAWQEERTELSSRVDNLESGLQDQNSDLGALASDLESTRDDLISLATQVDEQASLQASDVQRLEVEYLLRTARHISILTGDAQQALVLLQQADRLLADFNNLAYLPVREAVAQDIQSLRDVPSPDIDGLYFELQALADRSANWQWWPEGGLLSSAPREDGGVELPEATTWYEQLGRELRDLVTVRYRDDAVQQRLTPGEFNQMQAQFRLLTRQAQVALLQRNQTLYNASLEQAMEWLDSGAGQIPQAQVIRNQLARLNNIQIETELPDIDQGLNRLQAMTPVEEDNGESEE